MSSPAASHDGDASKKDLEQITFKFCSECSNMLYPQEDDGKTELLFMCRTCSYSEPASQYCIFRNVLNNQAGEVAGVTQDVGSDLTLPRSSKTCPSCGHGEAVFFQSQQRTADTGMKLFYVCCNGECGNIFQ